MESLGVNLKLLIAQLINFFLFFYIFKKFLLKPFSQFLKSEKNKEKEKERILDELKKKEEMMVAEEKKLKEKWQKEKEAILKAAKKEADQLKKEVINQAKKEAAEIIAEGRRQIEEEKRVVEKQIKEKVFDLSLIIIQKALKEFLTPDVQKKLNQNILKNFAKKIN